MNTTDYQDELLDTIIDLQERGFDYDFILAQEHICCLQYNELISPDDFEIIESHDCHDRIHLKGNYILFAIRLKNYNIKGIFNYQHFFHIRS